MPEIVTLLLKDALAVTDNVPVVEMLDELIKELTVALPTLISEVDNKTFAPALNPALALTVPVNIPLLETVKAPLTASVLPKMTAPETFAVVATVKPASGVIVATPTLLLTESTNKTFVSKVTLLKNCVLFEVIVTLECVELPVTTIAFATPGLTIKVPFTVAVLDIIKLAAVPTLTLKVKTLALFA